MGTFTKKSLSASSNNASILVAATSSPGTLLHTGVAGTTILQEVYLYAQNNHTADVALTIEFAGTNAKDRIELTLKSKSGLYLVVPGFLINNAAAIRAFCSVTNVVSIFGYLHEIEG